MDVMSLRALGRQVIFVHLAPSAGLSALTLLDRFAAAAQQCRYEIGLNGVKSAIMVKATANDAEPCAAAGTINTTDSI